MSVEQYQRTVNSLDRDIADLERKKAAADKKSADAQGKAARISIPKNASASVIRSRMRQIEGYRSQALRSTNDSADLARKIAEKRKKQNDAAAQLQKEEQRAQKQRDAATNRMKETYEHQIEELQSQLIKSVPALVVDENTDSVEYDVFISHAWEDKEDFVNEFVEELRKSGMKVWYDTSEIKWGDPMRKRIDDGLKKSRFGVAVISPNYIADGKYWTKAELDGLFQLESIGGKTLLPIWHNLTKADVLAYSPIIASRKAMTTATMTPREIAEKFRELLDNTEEFMHDEN